MKSALLVCDVTNQYYSILDTHGSVKVDYDKYFKVASKGFDIYRAFAYGAQATDEADGFIAALTLIGFEPRYRQAALIGRRPDIRRTDRNMMIAMDIWRTIEKVDVVIVGSNDPNLVPLIQRIKELGRQVIIYSHAISSELKLTADKCIELDLSSVERKRDESAASA